MSQSFYYRLVYNSYSEAKGETLSPMTAIHLKPGIHPHLDAW